MEIFRYFLLLVMTFVAALGGYNFKMITKDIERKPLQSVHLYIGLGFYILSAIINIYLLKYLPLTFVLPATSLSYIWIQIISKVKLKEKIYTNKIIAMIFIIIGVVLLGIN